MAETVLRGRKGGTLAQRITALRAQVARLEAANERLRAALGRLRDWCEWHKEDYDAMPAIDFKPIPDLIDAALSDAGEGWLPPEVREQAWRALEGLLRDMHTGTSESQRGSFHHDGLGCGRACETCRDARAALECLEVT